MNRVLDTEDECSMTNHLTLPVNFTGIWEMLAAYPERTVLIRLPPATVIALVLSTSNA